MARNKKSKKKSTLSQVIELARIIIAVASVIMAITAFFDNTEEA